MQTTSSSFSQSSQEEKMKEMVIAFQNSNFKKAEYLAHDLLISNRYNSKANLIAALCLYKKSMHNLFEDFRTISRGIVNGGFNRRFLRWTMTDNEKKLDEVELYLSRSAMDKNISLELNLAELRVDWNRNGRIDERDMLLFQIEKDANGRTIPENDPRRKPTFRFDHGDIYWARAFVAFQRSFINLLIAYDYPKMSLNEIERALGRRKDAPTVLTFKLRDKNIVHKAKQLILDGLSYADKSRELYLEETDDDREWLPNPRQKNHPMPLPVDEQLYETWKVIIRDLQNLVNGKEGLSLAELLTLGYKKKWWEGKKLPGGYINIGKLLNEPADIVLDLKEIDKLLDEKNPGESFEKVFKLVLGDKFTMEMKKSPIISQFRRMKQEVEGGKESFERKLRYLFWLN